MSRRSLVSDAMPALDFAANFSFMSALSAPPLRALHTLVRTTHERFSPPRVVPHRPSVTREQWPGWRMATA